MDCENSMTKDQEKDFINVLNKSAELAKFEMIEKLTQKELLLNPCFKAQEATIMIMRTALVRNSCMIVLDNNNNESNQANFHNLLRCVREAKSALSDVSDTRESMEFLKL